MNSNYQQFNSLSSNRLKLFLLLLLFIPNFLMAQDQLTQKLMMGYQGWFLCNGDQSAPNEWRHWFTSTTNPSAGNLHMDMWPDMSEYSQTYATNMSYADGSNARLFSSYDQSTTMVHFKWMKDYNIHGVYLQRFLGEAVNDPRFFQVRNHVLENVMAASQSHGRKYAIMYDISGVPDDGNLYSKLINDWEYLVDTYNMTQTNEYVKQNGKPVIAIWGIGFNNRGLNPATFTQIIDYFQNSAPAQYQAYVVGGVPGEWRTLSGDSENDPAWANVYHSLDMISPWTVGRYSDDNGIDNWKNQRISPDLADCNSNGVDYMPVIWPGFSWKNLHDGPLNQIPRNEGNFYWRQAYNALDAGADFIYVAMFDEVDEATAMFKIAETQQDIPAQGDFVTLDADGISLPSDWYLQLADETQKMLDNTISLSSSITISPGSGGGSGPYGGNAWSVPGTVEFENYDLGGQGVAYNDADPGNQGGQGRTGEGVDVESCSDGGLNVGWTSSGEWLEYTVDVASSGNYDFEFRIATPNSNGTFHVGFNGVNKTGTVTTPNTGGWQTWSSVSVNDVALSQGEQVMRVYLNNANYNLDKVIITQDSQNPGTTTYRIRNVWQNTYLADGGDRVTYSATPSGSAFEWQLENVDGNVEIKNVATGEYMHLENLLGYVQCTSRTFGWHSSRWIVEDAGNGEIRFENQWQNDSYIHIENLQGHAQYGSINPTQASAKWVLEDVSGARLAADMLPDNQLDVRIYPNPTADHKLTIDFAIQPDASSVFNLYAITGTLVKEGVIEGTRTTIQVGELQSGVYLLNIHSGGIVLNRQIVIK